MKKNEKILLNVIIEFSGLFLSRKYNMMSFSLTGVSGVFLGFIDDLGT